MKTNFWKFAALLGLGLAATVACQKETIPPVFPEDVVTNSDVTTTSETIKFTANLDWELSVPQETIAFFWLEDEAGNKLNKISGKAGEVTVKVGITDEPDFDNDITCNVTLKMGGESKVVATYTLLKSLKEFKAYANVITDGNLTWREEGGFKYEEQPTTEATLVYNEIYGFALPFYFEAGFNYDVDCPEWMVVSNNAVSENPVGKRGNCEVIVSVDLEKLTADVTSGELKIKVRNSDEVVSTIEINVPSLADFVLSEKATVNIGIDGKYLGELDACTFNVQTGSELTFVLAGLDAAGLWSANTSDFPYEAATLTVGERTGNGIIKSQSVSVAFEANDGPARTAYLLAMPAALVTDVQNGFNTFVNNAGKNEELPENFKNYVITTFTQEGVAVQEGEVLTFENAEWETMEAMHPAYNMIKSNFGESVSCYVARATSPFSIGSTTEIWGMEFYNSSFEQQNDLFTYDFFNNALTLSASVETYGLVLFQGESGVFAAVWVEYYASAAPAPAVEISFQMPEYVQGATLAKATDETFIQEVFYAGGTKENTWVLTYTTAQPSMAMINVPCMPKWDSAYGNETASAAYWLTYEQMDETSMYVDMKESGKTDFFLFEVGSTTYALICTYVAEEQGGSTLPEFVPTETLSFMMDSYGENAVLNVMSSSHPMAGELYSRFNTPNIWTLDVKNNLQPFMQFSTNIAKMEVLDETFNTTTSLTVGPLGPTGFTIAPPKDSGVPRIIVLKDNSDQPLGVVYYTFTF